MRDSHFVSFMTNENSQAFNELCDSLNSVTFTNCKLFLQKDVLLPNKALTSTQFTLLATRITKMTKSSDVRFINLHYKKRIAIPFLTKTVASIC